MSPLVARIRGLSPLMRVWRHRFTGYAPCPSQTFDGLTTSPSLDYSANRRPDWSGLIAGHSPGHGPLRTRGPVVGNRDAEAVCRGDSLGATTDVQLEQQVLDVGGDRLGAD